MSLADLPRLEASIKLPRVDGGIGVSSPIRARFRKDELPLLTSTGRFSGFLFCEFEPKSTFVVGGTFTSSSLLG